MVDKVVRVSKTEYVIIFDNRSPVSIVHDSGFGLYLIEALLSPRGDMSYSQYLSLLDGEKEDTNPCYVLEVA